MKFGPVTLKLAGDLLNFLNVLCPDEPIQSHLPLTFEAVKQDYGFLLYRTQLPQNLTKPTPLWVKNNGVHDRAYVMLDGVSQGILERDKDEALFMTGQAGSTLDVLLENMGRISFGYNISDFKGLIQPLVLGDVVLTDWLLFPLNIDALMDSKNRVFETQELNLKSSSGPSTQRLFNSQVHLGTPFYTFPAGPRARSGLMGLTWAVTGQGEAHSSHSTCQDPCSCLQGPPTSSHYWSWSMHLLGHKSNFWTDLCLMPLSTKYTDANLWLTAPGKGPPWPSEGILGLK